VNYTLVKQSNLTPPTTIYTDYSDLDLENSTAYRYYKLETKTSGNQYSLVTSEFRLLMPAEQKQVMLELGNMDAQQTIWDLPLLGDVNHDGVLSVSEDAAVNGLLHFTALGADLTEGLSQSAYSVIGNVGWDWGWAPWQAFDNDVNTSADLRESEPWRGLERGIQVDLGAAKVVSALGLTTRSSLHWTTNSSFDPTKVQVWGSNDGENFVAVTADPIALKPPSTLTTDYAPITFENSTAYRYYQIRVNSAGDYHSIFSEMRLYSPNTFEQSLGYVLDKQASLVKAGIDQVLLDPEYEYLIQALGSDLALLKGAGGGLQSVVDASGVLTDAQAHGGANLLDLSLFSRNAAGSALGIQASALKALDQSITFKDAMRLGVNAITVDASTPSLTVKDGTGSVSIMAAMPLIGDANLDGKISAAENSSVRVTYDMGDLTGTSTTGLLTSLASMRSLGIDSLKLQGGFKDATDGLPAKAFTLINATPIEDWGSQGGMPWHAFDNNYDSRAAIQQTNNLADPRGLKIDLGQIKQLQGIGLSTGNTWNWVDTSTDPQKITVLSSTDGVTYNIVMVKDLPLQYDRSSDYPDLMFDQAVSARYLKVQLYNPNSGQTTLSEVRVYESVSSTELSFDLGALDPESLLPGAAIAALPLVGDDNGDGKISLAENAAYEVTVRLATPAIQWTEGLPPEAFYGNSFDDWGSTNGGPSRYAFDKLSTTKTLFRSGNGDIANVAPLTIDLGTPQLVTSLGLTTVDTQTWGTGTQADPRQYELWGSTDGVAFSKISAGGLTPPTQRETNFPVVEFNNDTPYRFYQLKLAGSGDYWTAVSEIRLMSLQPAARIEDNAGLVTALKESGIDHLALNFEEANGHYLGLSDAWKTSGLDLTLKVNSWQAKGVAGVSLPIAHDLAQVVDALNHASGDFLSTEILHDSSYWKNKVAQLRVDGLNAVELSSTSGVHLNETLAQAMLEAGMLTAMPAATLMADVPATQHLMALSLDSMSELGVDKVNAAQDVWVQLGRNNASIQDLKDILSGFVNTQGDGYKHVFGERGAELIMDAGSFAALLADAQSSASPLVDALLAIGVDHVDVLATDAGPLKSYELHAASSQPVEVAVLGAHLADVADALALDVLPPK
jgi:hypothetical protein